MKSLHAVLLSVSALLLVILASATMALQGEQLRVLRQMQGQLTTTNSPAAETSKTDTSSSPAPARLVDSCPADYTLYTMKAVPFAFCYAASLGEPKEQETLVSPQFRQGTQHLVTFSKNTDLTVSLETKDYGLLGDRDSGPVITPVGYSCLNLKTTDAERQSCFSDKVASLTTSVDSQGRLRANAHLQLWQLDDPKKTVDAYYLFTPDVLKTGAYNLSVSADTAADTALIKF